MTRCGEVRRPHALPAPALRRAAVRRIRSPQSTRAWTELTAKNTKSTNSFPLRPLRSLPFKNFAVETALCSRPAFVVDCPLKMDRTTPVQPASAPDFATQVRTLPELLAPAGDWDCARAAVENGADAIYFGLERFNARMRANNFTEADLPELMAFL